jgi:hypothetical protein
MASRVIQRPEALIAYVRSENKRGDARHPTTSSLSPKFLCSVDLNHHLATTTDAASTSTPLAQ